MGLIYGKTGIPKLMVGYPTVSDKYDVGPAVLEGSTAVYPGDVVMVGSASGSYLPASSLSDMSEVAGIVLATNVKVPNTYPAPQGPVAVQPGEAFGLLVRGFVAVELDAGADLDDAVEGATVYLTAAGKCTTDSSGNIATPWKFMGIGELHGTAMVAEIVL